MKKWLIILVMSISLIISGCGGGGDTPPTGGEPKILKVADDNVTLNEDTNKTIDVLANDTNADNIVSVTNPSHGVAVIVGDKILYTPNNNYFGADSFEYTASNSDSNATAKVNITVVSVNDAPVANDINATTQEDTPKSITLSANDVEGDALTYSIAKEPSHGSVTINGDVATYTPSSNFNGVDSFKYKANDGSDDSNIAVVEINVTAVNDAPVIEDIGKVTTDEDTEKNITINVTDPDGDNVVLTAVSSDNTKADFTVNGNILTITPKPNKYTDASGISVTVTANDNNGGVANKTFTLVINPVNDAPVLQAIENKTVNEDSAPFEVTLYANDPDVGDVLTYSAVSSNTDIATVSMNANKLTVTLKENANGEVNITATVKDSSNASDSKTFKVTVTAVNDAPVANDDNATTDEDNSVSITLSANDVDGDSLSYTITQSPQHGTISGTAPNIVYTPEDNYNGVDIIKFKVNDGSVDSNEATINITINPVNDAPVANDDNATTDEDNNVTIDVLANDSDIDGDSLTIIEINPAPNKGVAVIENNKIVYSPNANKNGEDSFGYKISDGNGGETTGSVTVTINPINDAPTITSDGGGDSANINVAENSTAVTTVTATDVENDNISYAISGGEDSSNFDINTSSGELKFKDAPDYENPTDANGDNDYIVIVSASDASLSDTQTITVTVTDEDDTVSGKVSDGYVANAKIKVYSDKEMTTVIGDGSSDANGNFSVNISQQPIPDTVYIKSTGGVIIDTGMAAPTMYLMADTTSGSLNITPIGTTLYDMVDSGMSQSDAENALKAELGLNDISELYDDPMANGTLNNTMKDKVLSANTLSSSLADGNYTAIVSAFAKDDVDSTTISSVGDLEANLYKLTLTIVNGAVVGVIDNQANSAVTGYVSGTTLVLTINPDKNANNEVINVAGTIGQLGSCSGVMTVLNQTSGHTKGIFAAQFTPQGLDANRMNAMVNQMTIMASKTQDFIFRMFIGHDANVGIGTMVTSDINATTLAMSIEDANTTIGDGTKMLMDFSSNESRFLRTSIAGINGIPTNMAVRVFNLHQTTDPLSPVILKVYSIHPTGLRKALIVTVDPSNGKVYSVGDSYLSAKDTVVPHLKDNTTYKLAIANVHAGMINNSRDYMLNEQAIDDNSLETITTGPNMDMAFRYQSLSASSNGDNIMFFSGSVIGIYNDQDLDDFNDNNDSIDIVQLYQSGALDGEEVIGGTISDGNGGLIELKSFPGVFVGYLNEEGTQAVAINGKYNFVARALYDNNYTNGLDSGLGIINLTQSSATMQVEENNNTITYNLSVDFTNGIYHIYGAIGSSEYIDIAWPSGGKKAIYAISDNANGNGNVKEVGEAYLSR